MKKGIIVKECLNIQWYACTLFVSNNMSDIHAVCKIHNDNLLVLTCTKEKDNERYCILSSSLPWHTLWSLSHQTLHRTPNSNDMLQSDAVVLLYEYPIHVCFGHNYHWQSCLDQSVKPLQALCDLYHLECEHITVHIMFAFLPYLNKSKYIHPFLCNHVHFSMYDPRIEECLLTSIPDLDLIIITTTDNTMTIKADTSEPARVPCKVA